MIEIYDYKLNYLKSFPFKVETLLFDAEVRNQSTIRLLQLKKDPNFVPETDILINYYVFFRYDNYNYFGSISEVEVKENDIKIGVYLNYDIANIKFVKKDVLMNTTRTLYDMAERYFTNYLTKFNVPKVIIQDDINDETPPGLDGDMVIFNSFESSVYPYPEFARKMAKRGTMTDITMGNLDSGEPAIKIRVYIKRDWILEIDAKDKKQVNDLKYSFQDDIPNKIRFIFNDDKLGTHEETFIFNGEELLRESEIDNEGAMPKQIVPDTVEINWEYSSYHPDLTYAFALDYMALNYSNEITFSTTKEQLRMLKTDGASTFNFFELLNTVIAFYPDVNVSERSFFTTYISKLEVKESMINVTLGASRKRLTDKLKRRVI